MTSELITFNHLRCHSSSTALGILVTESQLREVQYAALVQLSKFKHESEKFITTFLV